MFCEVTLSVHKGTYINKLYYAQINKGLGQKIYSLDFIEIVGSNTEI